MAQKVIQINGLGKKYHIARTKKTRMLRDVITDSVSNSVKLFKSAFTSKNKISRSEQEIWALKDINFNVEAGESVGIIGSNGAGKSTLLKILARITSPTTGKVRLNGRVGSLLEVGTGFHAELTGRENVYLNGAILGMRQQEISKKFDEIVAFSEIDDYLDTPVKHYSSGMRMRLAFSVAAHLEPEILLIDEVLAVGDVAFQRKSLNKMNDVVGHGRTVLFVSHNMAAVRALCQRAIFINNGTIEKMGDVESVIQAYLDANEGRLGSEASYVAKKSHRTQLISATVTNSENAPVSYLPHDQPVYVQLQIQIEKPLSHTYINMKVYNQDMDMVLMSYDFEDDETNLEIRDSGHHIVQVKIPSQVLPPGKYFLGFEIARLKRNLEKSRRQIFHQVDHIAPFEIYDNGSALSKVSIPWKGIVHIPIEWQKVTNRK